ncbi:hypothetical protein LTS10_011131 [Elasticomyces elasticus]|nr:hypothetical protein LTS10_011131 [Elasticomyces elasticus]
MLTPHFLASTSRSWIGLCSLALFAFIAFLVLGWRSELGEEVFGSVSFVGKRPSSTLNSDNYDWDTLSAFNPVRQDIEGKSTRDLCKTFPQHLLHEIQPVIKTGHGVLETRLRPQLQSVSACLDTLIIISDVDEEFEGRQLIDIIAELPQGFRDNNKLLKAYGYFLQKALADNGTLGTVDPAKVGVQGWKLDKFKFLPQVSRAWQLQPEKRWYLFYEADTYVVWDNVFRLLSNFNPDVPLYFGSPSPGHDSWMANGGPGYILSREAVRRLVRDDFGADGAFLGSKLSERWENHVTPMHRTSAEDMIGLWRWEESRRDARQPLLYADLPVYLNLTTIPTRDDWNNAGWDGYPAPQDSKAHVSFQACGEACKATDECFQWTYHLRFCYFVRSFRLGEAKAPEGEDPRIDGEEMHQWSEEDKRSMAGWDLDGIRRWMDGEGRDCQTVQWVRPSVTRIF